MAVSGIGFWSSIHGFQLPTRKYCTSIVGWSPTARVRASAAVPLTAQVRKNLGSLYVTRKVDVGVDYIATPGESTSLEVRPGAIERS